MPRDPYSADIDIGSLFEGENLSREYYGDIKALAEAIKENEWLAPLVVVREGKRYRIIAGNRRLRAIRILIDAGDWPRELPCQVFSQLSDAKAAILNITENEERLTPNPAERMRSYRILKERHGYTTRQLSQRLGKSEQTVENYIRMGKQLHPIILKAVANGGDGTILTLPQLLTLSAKTQEDQLAYWVARSEHKTKAGEFDSSELAEHRRMRRRVDIERAIRELKRSDEDERRFGAKVLQWVLGTRDSPPWED